MIFFIDFFDDCTKMVIPATLPSEQKTLKS